jgi:parvulin-like peptidyl-prolyl isomerase
MEKVRVQIWENSEGQIFLAPWDLLAFKVNDGYLVFYYTEIRENELQDFEKKNLGVAVTLSTRTKEQILNMLSDKTRKSVFYFSKEIPQKPEPLY